ncbi:MAG TPA: amidohydrolase family protein [Candidatus Baltobacteraceae bacterium]|nr:amidohydrolase family protein [Candidatus Baltobacteraceae bacterium]
MRIFDAHHHLWDPRKRFYAWMSDDVAPIRRAYTLEDLRAALPSEVKKTIVVQAVSSIGESEALLRIAAASNGLIAGVVGWVDLRSDIVEVQLSRLLRAPGGSLLVGIRHQVHDERDPHWLQRDEVMRGLACLAEAGLTFDLLVRPRELPAAIATARELPQLQFVVDHGAKPNIARGFWEPWSSRMAQVAALPNVACKLSGLVTETDRKRWEAHQIVPYIRRLLNLFGPERLMFGSDWPVCTLAASYEQVLALAQEPLRGLHPSELDAIFYANAERVYGLKRVMA